jgi:hypothetical protein
MISTQPLDCDDLALAEKFRRPLNCNEAFRTSGFILTQKNLWPTRRAGYRLRVKAAICWVVILGIAIRIQRPRPHRSVDSVVG